MSPHFDTYVLATVIPAKAESIFNGTARSRASKIEGLKRVS